MTEETKSITMDEDDWWFLMELLRVEITTTESVLKGGDTPENIISADEDLQHLRRIYSQL